MTFGIPQVAWPIKAEHNGELDLRMHHTWLETMKAIEAMEEAEKRNKQHIENCQNHPHRLQQEHQLSNTVAPGRDDDHAANSVGSSSIDDHGHPVVGEGGTIMSGEGGDSRARTKMVVVPGPFDLVLGRGRHTDDSVGYLRFRSLLEEHSETYDRATTRSEKGEIANALLQDLKQAGCRFLRRNSEGFLEVCDESESRVKVSHAFRNIRKKKLRVEAKNSKNGHSDNASGIRSMPGAEIHEGAGDPKRRISELVGHRNQ
mmetsp:Transcript_28982/g.44575  ORF Transcript_28982/g.44575 Transcript_28982/m.44575 type:complete len:259 (+) Transcript_28982:119-895(+)